MAAVSCMLSEDQFQCSICLDVFTDPVSTPCGHTFCKCCINQHWDNSTKLNCPMCKEHFSSRPALKTNIVMSQMIKQFKTTSQQEKQTSCLKRSALGEGDVPCDLCSEPKLKAHRSCLLCLASYCHDHLQSHMSNPRLQRHQLVDAAHNLDERICPDHNAPIDMFCCTEAKLICLQCFAEEHKNHSAVPLKVQRESTEGKLKELIQERRQKIQDLQRSVELSQQNANKEIEGGVKVFDALTKCIQQSLQSFKKGIEEKHRNTEKGATEQIQNLKKEISDLEQKGAEMEEMSSSQDHLQFVQKFSSVGRSLKDWSKVKVSTNYAGTLVNAVLKLQNGLFANECKEVYEAHLRTLKCFTVNVTLDPDTAHRSLQVSEDKTEVTHTDKYVSSFHIFCSARFSSAPFVLGRQKFSSGQAYFEVVVTNKIKWALGVANDSAWRSGEVVSNSWRSGFWLMTWDNNKYHPAEVGGRAVWPASIPQKVGVFVDYDQSCVSFYDAGTAKFIGSITDCGFSGDIRPIFGPGENMGGKNSNPLKLGPNSVFGFGLQYYGTIQPMTIPML